MPNISILLPACHAEATIARAVQSVLLQSESDWELVVISDDGCDYRSLLAAKEIEDRRIQFVSTGRVKSGAAHALNVGLRAAQGLYVARICADDTYVPHRLEQMLPFAKEHGVVSCGLQLRSDTQPELGTVGQGGNVRLLGPDYKLVNLSADGMILYNREQFPFRFDDTLDLMSDFEFILQIFEKTDAICHLPDPLYHYYKHPASLSHSPYMRHIRAKSELLSRIRRGHYDFACEHVREGMGQFLEYSLIAEKYYEDQQHTVLFEHVIADVMQAQPTALAS